MSGLVGLGGSDVRPVDAENVRHQAAFVNHASSTVTLPGSGGAGKIAA